MDFIEGYADFFVKNVKYDLRQDILSCGSVMSLQLITMTNIAISLWKQHMLDEIEKIFSIAHSFKSVNQQLMLLDLFKKRIQVKVSLLHLTKPCKICVDRMLMKIGIEIERFLHNLNYLQFGSLKNMRVYLKNICWTQQGKINTFKMAEMFVNNMHIGVEIRYLMACNFCIHEKIRDLHGQLNNEFITNYLEEEDNDLHFYDIDVDDLIHPKYKKHYLAVFWHFFLIRETKKFSKFTDGEDISRYLLNWATCNHQYAAFQYIWENFGSDIKKDIIDFTYWTCRQGSYHITVYLLTQMDKDELHKSWVVMNPRLVDALVHRSMYSIGFLPVHYLLKVLSMMETM